MPCLVQIAQLLQVALGRDQHAGGAGYRLDDDGGDGGGVMQGDEALELVGQMGAPGRLSLAEGVLLQVVGVGQMIHAVEERAEELAIAGDAADGDAAEADAVIAALAPDQPCAGALADGALDRRWRS
jgi:hypothetical protein